MSATTKRKKTRLPPVSLRPTVTGKSHAVSTGHYLASMAAMRILDRGGNAIDAGVAASMALAVLQPDIVSLAGVAPTLIFLSGENRVVSLAGLGWWPAATDVERLRREGGGVVPEGILRTVMPAAPATHIEALRRWGTISFTEAAEPALELARDGFVVYPLLANSLLSHTEDLRRWPANTSLYLPQGRAPRSGEVFYQHDLAGVLTGMMAAEQAAGGTRDLKLRAAHDYFYRGPVAQAIAGYHSQNGGFVTLADLAGFEVPVENSISVSYRGHEVHSCDVWCQGISLQQALKVLEGHDLQKLGHNSPEYLHLVLESLNLAFGDREAYIGDPKFVEVPTAALLSDAYAARQRARIDPRRAFGKMPEGGNPTATSASRPPHPAAAAPAPIGMSPDTIYCCVMDKQGNAYSATLSDSCYDAPVIPGTGLIISPRGCQSRLEPGHPAEVKPGKRPRLTPSPALVVRDGKASMTLGTPGGDVQTQSMLQVFLNVTEFGMALQQAVEAPRAYTSSFPNSFAPHDYHPGRACLDGHMPEAIAGALRELGHDVEVWPPYPASGGAVCAIRRDPQTGRLHAGADPRREAYAMAW